MGFQYLYPSETDNYVYMETAMRELELEKEDAAVGGITPEWDAKQEREPEQGEITHISDNNEGTTSEVGRDDDVDEGEYGGFFSVLPVNIFYLTSDKNLVLSLDEMTSLDVTNRSMLYQQT